MMPPAPQRLVGIGALILIGTTLSVLLCPSVSEAQHQARLPKGLAARLAQQAGGTYDFLLTAPQAEIDRVASTYRVTVMSRHGFGALLRGSGSQIQAVAGDTNVGALALNEAVFSTMAVTTQATGASQLWQARGQSDYFGGLVGRGVGVAVIDSGVAAHPDIAGHVVYRKDFTPDNNNQDGFGHGTHVAASIAGNGGGSRSADGTTYVGMAPGAEIIALRVLGSDGTGYVADVIAAIEWCLQNMERFNIRIINLSLGHVPTSDHRDDPMAQAVERAVAAGIVVVSSAGNHGKDAEGNPIVGMVVSPGFTPGALTVGALNTRGTVARSDDGVATYSSRGPVGDEEDPSGWVVKPDVVAPGNAIVAAGAEGSTLWNKLSERRVIGSSGGTYLTLSGASMATAVCSGAVAQLLQARPHLTPLEVKFALQYTASPLAGFGLMDQGAGSINVPLAAELVSIGYVESAPTTNIIGGETVEASQTWSQTVGTVFANTIIWGQKPGSVTGDTIIWGQKPGSVTGDTIIWGQKPGSVTGDTIIWGQKPGSVTGDTIIWGQKPGSVTGDTIIWGQKPGSVTGDTIIWGQKPGSVTGDTIIWGQKPGSVTGDTIIWGQKPGSVTGDTIIWGQKPGSVTGDTIIWGQKPGSVTGDTIIWGQKPGSVTGDTIIWGQKPGSVTGDTIIWGQKPGSVTGDTIIWGQKPGSVTGDTIIWGQKPGSVTGDTIIWGQKPGSVTGDTIIWGQKPGSVTGDTIIWGQKPGSVTGDTIIWGQRPGSEVLDPL